jgi:uncharacterized membrane protein YvlD (DUF360 family)
VVRLLPLRLAGAALVLAAGAVHLWLYFDFFRQVHVVGTLFLLNAAAAAIIGCVLLVSSHPVAVAAGVAYAATTLGFFLISVHRGLFGYSESLRGGWQEAAGGLELAAIVVLAPALVAALKERRSPRG